MTGLIYKFIRNELYYKYVLYPYARIKHGKTDKITPKSNNHTYTSFYRSPGQLEVLIGPVMDFLLGEPHDLSKELVINVMAGSNGAEAYTIASILRNRMPRLKFHIHCSDLHDYTVVQAKEGLYKKSEVISFGIPDYFIEQTFDVVDDAYVVKQDIKQHITFFRSDIISESLQQEYPKADIILIQNVLFHLNPNNAYKAFDNVMNTAKNRCVIFMDGVLLSMRLQLVRQYDLKPVKQGIKEIHEYARKHIPEDWWNYYYGVEPYLFFMPDKTKRYGTIFKYYAN